MKAEKIIEHYSRFATALGSLSILAGAVLWITGRLAASVTLPVWALLLIVIMPLLIYFIAVMLYHRKNRRFQTGDFVSIISDDRKFVAIRYLFWFPEHVVCKDANCCEGLAINQKYLRPYSRSENPLSGMFPNINKFAPTVEIIKL